MSDAESAQHCARIMLPYLAHTSAAGGAFEGSALSARRALGVCWAPVLAALPEGATVDGVEALSPISFHISNAACVRLAQKLIVTPLPKAARHAPGTWENHMEAQLDASIAG